MQWNDRIFNTLLVSFYFIAMCALSMWMHKKFIIKELKSMQTHFSQIWYEYIKQ